MKNRTPATPSNLSKESVAALAERFSRQVGYDEDQDIRLAVNKLGGKIRVKDFWDTKDKTGSLVVSDVGDFQIYVPEHTSLERDRFTIAHELGHYVVHCLYKKDNITFPLIADRYGTGRVEWEANWFAASFLMPQTKFKRAFQKHGGDLYRIAAEFKVSEEAARVRAKSLGLLA